MAHNKRRQAGNVTPEDFARLQVVSGLPPAGHYLDRASALFEMLCGAQILAIGAPRDEEIEIEGGGLIIDFLPGGNEQPRRVVFGFNENGMWIEYEGPFTSTLSSL